MTQSYEEKQIATLVHGRYLVDRGEPAQEGRPLLVGFHGYGENAERHLEMLRRIPGAADWVICAVGALHRFYNTKTGDVIGSWMTSQQREQAIDDNVRYVAAVISALRRDERTSDALVLAGFSQGVAMAYRAAAGAGHPCHGVIALAGDVPPELADQDLDGFPPVLIGRGAGDGWYSEEKLTADVLLLRQKGVRVEFERFEGGHEWTADFHQRCAALLSELSASS